MSHTGLRTMLCVGLATSTTRCHTLPVLPAYPPGMVSMIFRSFIFCFLPITSRLPDAATLLLYLEVIETSDWANIILLQSVVEEFNRLASARSFNRLQKLQADLRRSCIVFPNERCLETYVKRRRRESIEARNTRGSISPVSFRASIWCVHLFLYLC
jgi:hypothetical protein